MNHPRSEQHARHGFTLIEALATIVALSVIAATLAPIIYAAGDSYSNATRHRLASESAAHAIDRIVRTIREIPSIEDSTTPDITTATPTQLTWSSTSTIAYEPPTQRLTLTLPGESPAILADRVEAFSFRYLDALAAPIDPNDPSPLTRIRRIETSLTIQGTEHRAAAIIRDGLGGE